MFPVVDPPPGPQVCGILCGLRTTYTKRSLLVAIKEGDLNSQGGCNYCGCLAVATRGVQQVKTAVGPKCLCWRLPISRCPKHGHKQAAAKPVSASASAQKQRVVLPYKKQTCDVIVTCGPLELRYPALVSEEKEPQGAATPPKVEEQPLLGLTLREAPEWLATTVYNTPWPKAPEVAPLTQRQEFSLLKKRLTRLGKQKMRLARRQRLDKLFVQKRARAATQRKVERVAALVVKARQQIALNELFAEAKRRAQTPLTRAQQALVDKSCRLACEERASWEAFLLGAKARHHRVCPHMAAREEVVPSPFVVRECTTPWAGLDVHITSLRDSGVVDGTLGVKSLAVQGDLTCNSSLGFPTRRQAISIMASSLSRARRVVRATINFVQQGLLAVKDVYDKTLNKLVPVKARLNKNLPEEEVKYTIWQGCQPPEMGVRNIYIFSDEDLPEEEVKYTGWGEFQTSESGVRNIFLTYVEEEPVLDWEYYNDIPRDCFQYEYHPLMIPYSFAEVTYDFVYPEDNWVPEDTVEVSEVVQEIGDRPVVIEPCIDIVSIAPPPLEECVVDAVSSVGLISAEIDPIFEDLFEACEDAFELDDESDLNGLPPRDCFQHETFYFMHRGIKSEGACILRKYEPFSFAFELEIARRTPAGVKSRSIKRVGPLTTPKLLTYLDGGDYIPIQKLNGKRFAADELDFCMRPFDPRYIRQDIHTYFIYRAECLEGCDWGDEDVAHVEIDECAPTNSSIGGNLFVPFALPIMTRGDYHSRGGVFQRLLNYTPFGDLTCNSSLGCAPEEIQERMVDRDDSVQPIDSIIAKLAVRKTTVSGAGENRVADKKNLTEKMVFHQPGIVKKLTGSGPKTIVAASLNSDQTIVRMQPPGKPSFTPLPRMKEEMMRKLLEKGFGSTSSVALDIGVQSHVPQGLPVIAFMNIMDTRLENPYYASLCGSYIDLGRDRAKTLCLPLANFPLSKSIEDVEDVLNGLVLATYFTTNTGFSVGRPVFQYGTLEFLEFKDSAYSDFSRVRDKWDEIAKRQDTPGDRILAGFSVLGAVSQDYNQALPEFDSIQLQCPPRNKPVVATYNQPPRLQRSGSTRTFRMPHFELPINTGRASISVQTDVRKSTRILDGEDLTPARHATCNSGMKADTSIVHVSQDWCPKDAKQGTVLGNINIREDIATSDNVIKYQWLAQGLISPKIKIRITAGSNPFIGLTLGVCCDYHERLGAYYDGTTNLPIELANQLPNFIFPLSESSVFEQEIDLSVAGYNLFQTQKHFADPVLVVYIVSTNTLPASDEWGYTIETCITSMEDTVQFALNPLVTLPGLYSGHVPLDIWRGPFEFKLGKSASREVRLGIDFGSARTYTTGKIITSFPAAYVQLLKSIGGIISGRVVQTGSYAISCNMYGVLQPDGTTHNLEQALRLPGCRIPSGGGTFAFRIQTAFARSPIFEKGIQLIWYAMGGPIGATTMSAPYQFMVYFDHILEEEGFVPRTIGTSLSFVWATLSAMANTNRRFQLPMRLSDLVLEGKTVVMRPNALASLIASCGFFRGKLTFVFQWALNVTHVTTKSSMQTLLCVGTLSPIVRKQVFQSTIVNLGKAHEIRVDVDLVDFPGYNSTGGLGASHNQPFIDIWCDGWDEMSLFNINVEIQPGFELYGRSITPVK